jgi:hypothetical protein
MEWDGVGFDEIVEDRTNVRVEYGAVGNQHWLKTGGWRDVRSALHPQWNERLLYWGV